MKVTRAIALLASVGLAAAVVTVAAPAAHAQLKVPQGWTNLGDPLPGAVHDVVNYRGTIYAAGTFGSGLARWDADKGAWTMLGDGPARAIHALAVGPDGTLYGAGEMAGDAKTGFVAAWQDSSWKDLGQIRTSVSPSMPGVWQIAVDSKGRLYVGGMFDRVDGMPVNNLAQYDGKKWSATPGPIQFPAAVTALAVGPKDELYVGAFAVLDPKLAYASVLKQGAWSTLDGLTWDCKGLNPCMGILSMAVDPQGTVHAAGELAVGSTLAAYATWNGSSWTAGATQSMNRASALTLDQAGTAYVAGGQYPDPDKWMVARMSNPPVALGAPTGGIGVWALTVRDGSVYAGFSQGNPDDPTTSTQMAAFALPAKNVVPSLPRNVRIVTAADGRPLVAWKAPAFATSATYQVQFRLEGDKEWRPATVIDGKRLAKLPRGVAGERIEVRVRASGGAWAIIAKPAP